MLWYRHILTRCVSAMLLLLQAAQLISFLTKKTILEKLIIENRTNQNMNIQLAQIPRKIGKYISWIEELHNDRDIRYSKIFLPCCINESVMELISHAYGELEKIVDFELISQNSRFWVKTTTFLVYLTLQWREIFSWYLQQLLLVSGY